MRVITDRSLQAPDFPYRWDCEGCKSTLESDVDDVKYGEFGGIAYAGERGTMHFYVECPICATNNVWRDGQDSRIPLVVKTKLQAEYRRRRYR